MANLIPQEKITEIQHAIDIVQIISEYVQLKQQGRNFTGLCPFHSEKTPSFMVNPEKKLFKCFGCGEGGTVFNFVMKQEGLGFVESVKLVASKAHIDITHLLTQRSSVSDTEKARLVKIHDFVAKVYHKFLLDSKEGTGAREYLGQRKINEQSIKNFCLGYAPSGWDTLIKIGKDRSISTAQMEKTGLILPGKEKEHYYDRFRNRLMFPIVDARKRVIGFGGRTLDNSLPKYLNSPETVLFNKSSVLYGIDVAKAAIMKQRRAILMEGYTDVIMAHQHGIDWSVAVMGTAISKQHLKCLRQYCQEVVLLLDADTAGWKSSDRSLDIFIEEEFDVKIAQLPAGYDPCDYLVAEGAEKFLGHVNNAKDFFRFKVEMATSKWDMATVNGRANAINDVLSTAMKMPDIIKRNLLIKMIAEEMSVDETALREQFKKINQRPVHTGNKKQPPPVEQRFDASSMAERELLYLMLSCNEVIPRIVAEIGLEEFDNKDFSEIAEKVVDLYNKNTSVKGEDVLHALEDLRLNKLLMDVVTGKEFQNVTNHSERLEACIHYFKMRNSKKDVCQAKKRTLENVKVGSREEDIVALLDELHKKHRDRHALKGKA